MGEGVLAGTKAKTLYLDTGQCIQDITTTPLELLVSTDYMFVGMYILAGSAITELVVNCPTTLTDVISIDAIDEELGLQYLGYNNIEATHYTTTDQLEVSATTIATLADGFRLICVYERVRPLVTLPISL